MSDQPVLCAGSQVVVRGVLMSEITGKLLNYDCFGVILMDPTPGEYGISFIPWQQIERIDVLNFPRGMAGRAA